ncbi:hypothetical protein N7510_002975 [Penicillium lagena]|uniref:uncharacterized protein n=1 Tax=Penicillium lagena TaxID=94218 RepID=UPI0025414DDE|nr:uncharacterized protein N7510_002975 [Penicillium lagena]KAJ5618991.1 hypothetical protein N7510_002975 [Penicillium lagena]
MFSTSKTKEAAVVKLPLIHKVNPPHSSHYCISLSHVSQQGTARQATVPTTLQHLEPTAGPADFHNYPNWALRRKDLDLTAHGLKLSCPRSSISIFQGPGLRPKIRDSSITASTNPWLLSPRVCSVGWLYYYYFMSMHRCPLQTPPPTISPGGFNYGEGACTVPSILWN